MCVAMCVCAYVCMDACVCVHMCVCMCVMAYRIWKYLAGLTSSQQSTVIITTHYIEEAKMAHTVIIPALNLCVITIFTA